MLILKLVVNSIIAVCLALTSQALLADLTDDAEDIFNSAEMVYSGFFPSRQETKLLEPWLYRYYAETGVYLGVNKTNSGVYVLGGNFGNPPKYVDHKNSVMEMLVDKKHAFDLFCKNTPEGASCKQNGYEIYQTTHGQCLKTPENDLRRVETGTSVQLKVTTTKLQFNGLKTTSANKASFIDTVVLASVNQCIINPQGTPPDNLSKYQIRVDICLDVTDDFESIASDPDTSEFNPPITTEIIGTGKYSYVDDCFATDAVGIFNRFTREVWLRNSQGEFIKL